MLYIAKVTLYHNTKGLIEEGATVEFTKDEVAEYDKGYFKDLFETVGAEETAEVEEEPTDTTEEKPKAKAKGKKAEETAE
nr:MAG TPA: hypothetical protein [Caudoviricetes sp.]